MPYKDPDPEDPMVLQGIRVPTKDNSSMQEMADCFVQEFFRLRKSPEDILALFKDSFYKAPHKALLVLGEESIRDIISMYSKVYCRQNPMSCDQA